ncbi:MAG TPA: hypothetical protein VN840_06385 [Streptosporangiaceae bacterium]|nr:hypothetical protein [Streptosporangiaceae bacterium]
MTRPARAGPEAPAGGPAPAGQQAGRRRGLQLGLASLWLLDAMLQGQSFMFSRNFARMLTAAARGSPAAVSGPGNWAAHLIGQHPAAANSAFVAVQLLLALGIAWRPRSRSPWRPRCPGRSLSGGSARGWAACSRPAPASSPAPRAR